MPEVLKNKLPLKLQANIERFINVLQSVYAGNLVSVVAYGSVVSGEYVNKLSDVNTLIVLEKAGVDELDKIRKYAPKWMKDGIVPPLIFTEEYLKNSLDTFPVEFIEIRETHVTLSGREIFDDIVVSEENVRTEAERDLKSNMLRLRQGYIAVGNDVRQLKQLMIISFNSLIAQIKALLRIRGKPVKGTKEETLKAFFSEFGVAEKNSFLVILEIKNGKKLDRKGTRELFGAYMDDLLDVINVIDRYKTTKE